MKTLLERFESKIEKTDSCWLWTGAVKENGYGHFNGRREGLNSNYVHRISWEIYKKSSPGKEQVLHKCDVRLCVNPAHLFLGTQQDNMQDMKGKGRAWYSGRTHCKNGHEYTPENTRMDKTKNKRICRKCLRTAGRRYYARRKEV